MSGSRWWRTAEENNPTAKILVADPKEKFSKQALFEEGWEKHYPAWSTDRPGFRRRCNVEVDPAR
jgi:sulfide dehydrogenase [flavocytochrome c] flavoprotein subunit